jgi:outer membrane receptor protein involved in Fe transport
LIKPLLRRLDFQTQNVGRARIQGFEADAEFPIKIGLGFLTPSGNISYLRGDDLETNEPLDFITPLKTVLNIRWTSLITDVTQ